ncbi:hypothetical protein [Nocardia sp. bgisy118]|uniref:hypothetical protein n=1 Tax=Nocardia sp. bgisy118 TaxID=3413786 RepID=UPI003F49BEBC
MTRPDQGPSNNQQGQPNPFDTGLPMLRLPAPPTGKRRRRRPAARRSSASSGAPLRAPEPPRTPPRQPEPPRVAPPVMPEPFYGTEPPRTGSPSEPPRVAPPVMPEPFYEPESPRTGSPLAGPEPFYQPEPLRTGSPSEPPVAPPVMPEPFYEPESPRTTSPFAGPTPFYEPEPPRAEPPVRQPPRRMGEWAEWLDPPIRSEEPSDSPTVEIRVPVDEEPEPERGGDEGVPVVPAIIDRTGGNPGPALRRPRPRQPEQQPERGNKLLAVLIGLGVLVAVGSILWAVLPSSGTRAAPTPTRPVPAADDARPTVSPTPTGPESPAAVATPGCEQRRTGDVVSGTDIGGTLDGPSAIMAFERAYYVQRSGVAARAVVAQDATVPPAEQIQRGIDQVPVGTRYCVQITRTAAGAGDGQSHWEVRLTQQYPGQLPKTFTQIITTKTLTGRTLITGISMA